MLATETDMWVLYSPYEKKSHTHPVSKAPLLFLSEQIAAEYKNARGLMGFRPVRVTLTMPTFED